MAHDFSLENQPGAAFRVDLNNAIQTLASLSVGEEPPTKYSGQMWWDFSNQLIKIRNFTNTAWITWAFFDGSVFSPYRNGTALGTASVLNTGTTNGTIAVIGAGDLLPASVIPEQTSPIPVGSVFFRESRDEPTGWIASDGRTIGDDATGAGLTGAYLEPLFEFLWDKGTNAENQVWDETSTPGTPIPVTRNITAEADWQAGRTISLTRYNGRGPIGLDDMGGTAANLVTSASLDGENAIYAGGLGGAETHSLTTAQNAAHSHSENDGVSAGVGGSPVIEGGNDFRIVSGNTGSSGSGSPHNNMPPWVAGTWLIKW